MMRPRQIIARGICCGSAPCQNEQFGHECGQLGSDTTASLPIADAILTALRSAGFAVVPMEPTTVMLQAAADVDSKAYAGGSLHGADDEQIWAAMVAAAQEDAR